MWFTILIELRKKSLQQFRQRFFKSFWQTLDLNNFIRLQQMPTLLAGFQKALCADRVKSLFVKHTEDWLCPFKAGWFELVSFSPSPSKTKGKQKFQCITSSVSSCGLEGGTQRLWRRRSEAMLTLQMSHFNLECKYQLLVNAQQRHSLLHWGRRLKVFGMYLVLFCKFRICI